MDATEILAKLTGDSYMTMDNEQGPQIILEHILQPRNTKIEIKKGMNIIIF